jgi:hypothetical protein
MDFLLMQHIVFIYLKDVDFPGIFFITVNSFTFGFYKKNAVSLVSKLTVS